MCTRFSENTSHSDVQLFEYSQAIANAKMQHQLNGPQFDSKTNSALAVVCFSQILLGSPTLTGQACSTPPVLWRTPAGIHTCTGVRWEVLPLPAWHTKCDKCARGVVVCTFGCCGALAASYASSSLPRPGASPCHASISLEAMHTIARSVPKSSCQVMRVSWVWGGAAPLTAPPDAGGGALVMRYDEGSSGSAGDCLG